LRTSAEVLVDYTIKIGGEAGQGIQTVGDSLARVFARSGYHLFIHQDYESRIRGGHNFFQIRVSEMPVVSSRDRSDIVIALDKPSIAKNRERLAEGGIIVYDSSALGEKHQGDHFLDVPFVDLATKDGGSRIMANTVATGAVLGMLGMDLSIFLKVIGELFEKKGPKSIEENRRAAERGREYAVANCKACAFTAPPLGTPLMLIDGNSAVGLGALLSGCRFYTAYPMTPSTGVLTFMASKSEDYGIAVEQAEDEIAAINMAIGASYAGVRAMTGTAGGGFALMVEGVSLAAMTETPVVVLVGQRPAPATGLPTRTEQGDLLFVLHAGHGEFPRILFAPGSPEQAFFLTNKAFDLASKYQVPAFILTDQYLADSQCTYEGFDLSRITYEDYRLRENQSVGQKEYSRYAYVESGVSPFAVPGRSNRLVVADSDEHDEAGHLTEDDETRRMMVEKRLLLKLPRIRAEIDPPLLYGSTAAETIVVGWGSTYGVLKEAVDRLGHDRVALLHFSEIFPFPGRERFDYVKLLGEAKTTICVEQNATSQLARLIKAETGHEFTSTINRYDGRPWLLETLTGELDGKLQ
jgi:2-oxoglutarate/2-oxoacid ferredoxin oxidoreductase subunit alpha